VVRQRYPATGAHNARVDLFVADLAAESRQQLDLGADADVYLPDVEWFPDSRGIAVQRQSRDQKTLELLRFDALSGRGRVLITEHNDFWVPLNHELTFLRRTPQFIWASSRDGFQHLLYGNDGQLIRQLTSGRVHGRGRIAGGGGPRRRRARRTRVPPPISLADRRG
jgi:dipeptidyl-peptidase-4